MSSGLILVYGIGAILGPLSASAITIPAGPMGMFIFVAGGGLLVVVFTLVRMRRRSAPPAEDKEAFQVVSGTTTTISPEFDPRGDPDQAELDFTAPGGRDGG